MSRAAYVWIVLDGYGGSLRAVFTVRYECADWLNRHPNELVAVCRMQDGHRHPEAEPVWLDRDTLEPIEMIKEEEA